MLNLLFLEKLQHLLSCESERVLHVGNFLVGITIGGGFVSKIHCHFRLSFNFCFIHSRWCSRRNSFMLTKISLKVISDTVTDNFKLLILNLYVCNLFLRGLS